MTVPLGSAPISALIAYITERPTQNASAPRWELNRFDIKVRIEEKS